MDRGEKISVTGERLQIKELVFFDAADGFDIDLEGMRSGRSTNMLTMAEGLGGSRPDFTAVVGLLDHIAKGNAIAIQVLLDTGGNDGAAFFGKRPD